MKIKNYIYLIIFLITLSITACSGGGGDSEGESILTSIELYSSDMEIESDGIEEAVLSAKGFDQNGKEIALGEIAYYLNNLEIDNVFTSEIEGEYKIKAISGNVESDEIVIKVIKTPVVISDKAIIMKAEDLATIESFDEANGKIVFSKQCEKEYKKDDVIVSGITAIFPYGMLGKITEVKTIDGKVEVIIEKAAITDVVESGKVNSKIDLKASDLKQAVAKYDGMSMRMASVTKGGKIDFDFVLAVDSVLYDEDGNHNTTDDQIKLEGELSIDPGIDFNLDIGFFEVHTFAFGVDTNISGNLVLKGDLHKSWSPKEISLIKYNFFPITIFLAEIPIVISPSMELVVGASGEINGKFRYSLSEQATAEVKLGYYDGDWKGTNELDNNFDFAEPEIEANAEFKMYAGAKLGVALYSDLVAAGYGKVLLYFRGEADINSNPWWSVYGGIEAVLGFEGLGIGPYQYDMPIYESKIVSADYFNDGDGVYDPDKEIEKGWVKEYKFIETMCDIGDIMNGTCVQPEHPIMLLGDYQYRGVTTNGENGFVAVNSASLSSPSTAITEYDKNGKILKNKLLEAETTALWISDVEKCEGGYIVAGVGGAGLLVAKLDENFDKVWVKSFDVPIGGLDFSVNLSKLNEDKFMVDFIGSFVMFDANGVVERLGNMTYNAFTDVEGEESVFVSVVGGATINGDGYLIAGNVGRGVFLTQGVVAKYDNDGTLIWDKHIIIQDSDEDTEEFVTQFTALEPTEDGGFYLTGACQYGLFIAKHDELGNGKWLRVFGNDDHFPIYELAVVADVGVVGVGRTFSIDENEVERAEAYLVKFSKDGVYGWSKVLKYNKGYINLYSICKRDDNKMITAVGSIGAFGDNGYVDYNQLIMSITPNGEIDMEENSDIIVENFISGVITNYGMKTDSGIYEILEKEVVPEDVVITNQEFELELIKKY